MDAGTAFTIMTVTGTLTTGAVLILRPISKRLGALLDVMAQQRLNPPPRNEGETARIRELLTSIDSRLTLLEERQDFAEALISAGDTKLLSIQSAQAAQERN
ncbi:MAG TPA: hypothetical protein VHG91_22040 [Longimicrobium sp.]|nr:hypothetical protein [Longimicrobium sp.]